MASGQGSSLDEAEAEGLTSPATPLLTPPLGKWKNVDVDKEQKDSVIVTTVYFVVGDRHEAALVPRNALSEDVKGELDFDH